MNAYVTPLTSAAARCPHPLLDNILDHLSLKNDAALAKALNIAPPRISKIRRGHTEISAALLLRLHEVAKIPVAELRRMVQDAQQMEPKPSI